MFLCSFSNSCHPHGLFPAKKASKFRDWLDCSTLELKPNSMAMEILSYLAYETVAQACEVNVLDISQRQPRRRRASLYILKWLSVPRLWICLCWWSRKWPWRPTQSVTWSLPATSTTTRTQRCDTHSWRGVFVEFTWKLLLEVFLISFCFVTQLKKDPDSPEATPPSTPGSSHTSKPLLQGNGSLDSRARQRKRKKVRGPALCSEGACSRSVSVETLRKHIALDRKKLDGKKLGTLFFNYDIRIS